MSSHFSLGEQRLKTEMMIYGNDKETGKRNVVGPEGSGSHRGHVSETITIDFSWVPMIETHVELRCHRPPSVH